MPDDDKPSRMPPASEFHAQILAVLPSLRQQALALTRHRADAEDLVHSAIANALAAHASFEPGTNFKAWIVRILRNRFFSDIRRQRETVDLDDAPASHLGRSGNQEESIDVKDLWRHLSRLPTDQSLILTMVSLEGFSYDEASAYLRVAVGTLKCRVFRARTQLMHWMQGEEVGAKILAAPARPKNRVSAAKPVVAAAEILPEPEGYALAAD
jgi:RNA polymerase sigma-70 factor (ECF subfamily)